MSEEPNDGGPGRSITDWTEPSAFGFGDDEPAAEGAAHDPHSIVAPPGTIFEGRESVRVAIRKFKHCWIDRTINKVLHCIVCRNSIKSKTKSAFCINCSTCAHPGCRDTAPNNCRCVASDT